MKGDTHGLNYGELKSSSSVRQTVMRASNPQSSGNVLSGGSSQVETSHGQSAVDDGIDEGIESQASIEQSERPGGSEGTAEVDGDNSAQNTAETDDDDSTSTAEVDGDNSAKETAEADNDDCTAVLEGLSAEQLRKIRVAVEMKLGEKAQKAGPKSELQKLPKIVWSYVLNHFNGWMCSQTVLFLLTYV
jgi:hypothetical protein